MEKKSEIERKCLCGRIITDPNNKTGLCPSCQKKGNTILGGAGLAVIGVGIKKFGPKILKSTIKLIKK